MVHQGTGINHNFYFTADSEDNSYSALELLQTTMSTPLRVRDLTDENIDQTHVICMEEEQGQSDL